MSWEVTHCMAKGHAKLCDVRTTRALSSPAKSSGPRFGRISKQTRHLQQPSISWASVSTLSLKTLPQELGNFGAIYGARPEPHAKE